MDDNLSRHVYSVMLKAEAVLRSAVSSQEVAREWQYCHAIICCWIVCMVLAKTKKRLHSRDHKLLFGRFSGCGSHFVNRWS